jgi:hypothetical protein
MSNPVSIALTTVSPTAFTSFRRMFVQVRPSTENTNFAISVSEKPFGM